jgi:hypothetical protein
MQEDIAHDRRPRDATRAAFYDLAEDAGWKVATRGWPDFLLQKDDRIIAVQTIPTGRRKLRQNDAVLQGILTELGVPCFAWSPDLGLAEGRGKGGREVEIVERETTARALDHFSVSLSKRKLDTGESEGIDAGAGTPAAPLEAAPPLPSRSETSSQVDAVWGAYVAVMKPRQQQVGDDERLVIRAALKVATVEELVTCIKTCEASDFHMKRGQHVNRKGERYKSIAKILKPRPRREETQRSRIDWWLDRANAAGVAGFPSADTAIVSQRQVEVQRGHHSDDPEMVRKANDAEAWLATHGIETVRRRADGYPTFRRIGSE